MSLIYPWQYNQWQYFMNMLHQDSLPHALMLCGPGGIGKHEFANAMCASIICQARLESGEACGQCKHCKLLDANTFPDYVSVEVSDEKAGISVEDIRQLIAKLHLTRHFDAYKVALIRQADLMNTNAANALLKTLEEPPAKSLILLVTDQPLSLPATIRSRCQLISFNPPGETEALDWLNRQSHDIDWEPLLRVAQGAPLQALQFHETDLLDQRIMVVQGFLEIFEAGSNPVEIAARIEPVPLAQCFQWIQAVIVDLLRIKAAENPITLENPDFYRSLLALAPRLQVPLLVEFWEMLLERKKMQDNSLNHRLYAESFLLRTHKLAAKNIL